jgi:hypothetical protein
LDLEFFAVSLTIRLAYGFLMIKRVKVKKMLALKSSNGSISRFYQAFFCKVQQWFKSTAKFDWLGGKF